jgi:prevent-host-death family protein
MGDKGGMLVNLDQLRPATYLEPGPEGARPMPEHIVNLYEAKTQLSNLVERAAAGEEIIIAKAGKPKARLVPLATPKLPRRPGGAEGKIWMADDFDDPLPDDIMAGFEGRDEVEG